MKTRRTEHLARLSAIADMLREHRLSDLRAAGAEVAGLRAQIARLDAAGAALSGAESFCTAPSWLRWQTAARADLNIRLAAALAAQDRVRDAARMAFGRAEVLHRLRGRDQAS